MGSPFSILYVAMSVLPLGAQDEGAPPPIVSIHGDESPAEGADAQARRWLARAYLAGEVAEELRSHPLGNGHGRALQHLEQVLGALAEVLGPQTSAELRVDRGIQVLASVELLLERHRLIEAEWDDRSQLDSRPEPHAGLEEAAIRLCQELKARLELVDRPPGGGVPAGTRSLAQYEAQWRLRRSHGAKRRDRPRTRASLDAESREAQEVAQLLQKVDALRLGTDMGARDRRQLDELGDELSEWTGDLVARIFPTTMEAGPAVGDPNDSGSPGGRSFESGTWQLDALKRLVPTEPRGASATLNAHLQSELAHMLSAEGDHAEAFAQWTHRIAGIRRIAEVQLDPSFQHNFGPGPSGLDALGFEVVPADVFPWNQERGLNELVRRGEPLGLELHRVEGQVLASSLAEVRILDAHGESHPLEGFWNAEAQDTWEPLLLRGYDYIVEFPEALQPVDSDSPPRDLRIIVADWPPETLPLELPSMLLPEIVWISRKRTIHDSSTGDREWFGLPERPWTRLHAGQRLNAAAGVAPRPMAANLSARAYLELLFLLGHQEFAASSVPQSESKRAKALGALGSPDEPYAPVDLRAEKLREVINDYQFPTNLPEGEFAAWIEGFAAQSLGWNDLLEGRLLANPGDIVPGMPYVVRESLRLTGGR